MKNKDYISDGLIHVRNRLKEYAHPATSIPDVAHKSENQDASLLQHPSPATTKTGRKSGNSNKELKKARMKRSEEYLRFHRDLAARITACRATLAEETRHYQKIVDESVKFQEAVDKMLIELEELRNFDENPADDPAKLGEIFRRAEHLRLEFIRRQAIFSQLTEKRGSGKQHTSGSTPSLLPEIGSLEFSQIFKLSLACGLPIIIAIIVGSVTIALAILISMGIFR